MTDIITDIYYLVIGRPSLPSLVLLVNFLMVKVLKLNRSLLYQFCSTSDQCID